jgi:hypothetical protein
MVESETDACISRLGTCRFGRRMDLCLGFRKDPLDEEFRQNVNRYRHRPSHEILGTVDEKVSGGI